MHLPNRLIHKGLLNKMHTLTWCNKEPDNPVVSQFGFLALEGLPVCRIIINADHHGSMGASYEFQEAPMEPAKPPLPFSINRLLLRSSKESEAGCTMLHKS